MTELPTTVETISPATLEIVFGTGDLQKLTSSQRVEYYLASCAAVGLNAASKPFDFIKTRDGSIKLYANANAAAQLRVKHGITITESTQELMAEGLYRVQVRGRAADGREDVATGLVPTAGMKGQDLANALMKAETVAHRRLSLSLGGLGASAAEDLEMADAGYRVMTGTDPEPAPLADRLHHAADALAADAPDTPDTPDNLNASRPSLSEMVQRWKAAGRTEDDFKAEARRVLGDKPGRNWTAGDRDRLAGRIASVLDAAEAGS